MSILPYPSVLFRYGVIAELAHRFGGEAVTLRHDPEQPVGRPLEVVHDGQR